MRIELRRMLVIGLLLVSAGCLGGPDRHTLADLRGVEPDLREAEIDDGLDQAMQGYRAFLEDAPKSSLTPEAMRRLADLALEKEFGPLSGAERQAPPKAELAAPKRGREAVEPTPSTTATAPSDGESREEFERRVAQSGEFAWNSDTGALELPEGQRANSAGPLEAIELYDQILESYPGYAQNDQVLYQKARALDELGRNDEAIVVTARLIAEYPHSRHLDEVQFRRAEYFFMRKKFFEAEEAYGAIVAMGSRSDYYPLALYKLGWTLYKQMMLEEALEQYITLLDYKVATGTDFDHFEDEGEEARVADTFRVISLCFSDLGGADVLNAFFADIGSRSYEDRVYKQLGEFYFEKLRYHDAALVYTSFLELYPMHIVAPHFSMRIVEIYDAGGFPKLVLEAKKEFARRYRLQSDYWTHFDVAGNPEVMTFLKQNLRDLANHYHALYQNTEQLEERPEHFQESTRWYREYLASFAEDPETPGIHYRFADLLLENESYDGAARQYEKIAYGYAPHEQAADAGYAAVFAHREHAERATGSSEEPAVRDVVTSSIRFADHFPKHEQAATILAAAAEDLYGLKDYSQAIETGHRLLEQYPNSEPGILRATWTVVAHASFDNAAFASAEEAYARVLEVTPRDDESVPKITNNLAASIYKQGEQASEKGDDRAAADHFLRIATVAPGSEIRPVAEYDAASALIRLEDWMAAAGVLEAFRTNHPDHELNREATRQVAFVYREAGELTRAGNEYERVADEAKDPEMRSEALLVAGELYEDAGELPSALRVYGIYVTEFTDPLDRSVVTRFKMAELHAELGNEKERRSELERIVAIDARAGDARTSVVRTFAGRSALLLSEVHFDRFAEIQLTQPFDASLKRKQARMQTALGTFEKLVDYGVAEVTAAATYYMAEVYKEFSRALVESERPADLSDAELLDYQDVLEEEAYPFEEKAIAVHEKNLELVSSGVFNDWIEKSLGRLAVMMPGRYAKRELTTGPLASIDTYVYRVPTPAIPDEPVTELAHAADEDVHTTEAAPAQETEGIRSTEGAPAQETAGIQSTEGAPAQEAEGIHTTEAAPAQETEELQSTESAPAQESEAMQTTEAAPAQETEETESTQSVETHAAGEPEPKEKATAEATSEEGDLDPQIADGSADPAATPDETTAGPAAPAGASDALDATPNHDHDEPDEESHDAPEGL